MNEFISTADVMCKLAKTSNFKPIVKYLLPTAIISLVGTTATKTLMSSSWHVADEIPGVGSW